ncbi:UPF0481 protein [Camellia lanceoleosa]|uniref:UPF0481 protein n=1 Tax=Camellia lanceoleosa TaxID=1840588 RepID=A0ACC0HRT2_9ERIC|nr:UPF0481 protein [Camellia lanceoleosa]
MACPKRAISKLEGLMKRLTEAVGKKIDEGTCKTEFTSLLAFTGSPMSFVSLTKVPIPLASEDRNNIKSPVHNIKLSYMNSLLYRSTCGGSDHCQLIMLECLTQMRESLEEAKKCYVEEVCDKLDEEMLLIDSCFILELLYKFKHEECKKSQDPVLASILTAEYIQHDLLLLENQLPFFVLQSDEDVHVLHKARIIHNHIGTREDAKLFNNLCKEVVLKGSYFAETINAADRYSKDFWSDFMACLRCK